MLRTLACVALQSSNLEIASLTAVPADLTASPGKCPCTFGKYAPPIKPTNARMGTPVTMLTTMPATGRGFPEQSLVIRGHRKVRLFSKGCFASQIGFGGGGTG
jgi:hypothetical protein